MTIEELIKFITEAFRGVEQPTDITLHVAEAHDGYDYENNKSHQKNDYVGAWQDVPEAHIWECRHALNYLDRVGMRYYLPAYMVWTLKKFTSEKYEFDHVLYALDNHPNEPQLAEYQKERFSLFNAKQMRACALFVRFCAEDAQDEIDSCFAQMKFKRYWNRYV